MIRRKAARGMRSKDGFFSHSSASCSRNFAAMKDNSVLPTNFHDEASKVRGFTSAFILIHMIYLSIRSLE